jgi:hypothetical protein
VGKTGAFGDHCARIVEQNVVELGEQRHEFVTTLAAQQACGGGPESGTRMHKI